jgi:predicted metal-binding protein
MNVATPIAPRVRTVASGWQGAVLLCRKCGKKMGGGFGAGGKKNLAKLLRKALGTSKGRKGGFGVVEVGCLGVCPRDAVTLVDTAHPDRWRIVPRGADVAALAQELRADDAD